MTDTDTTTGAWREEPTLTAADEPRRRADAGRPRQQPRDVQSLAWLADMRAAFEPDVGVLLGRLAGRGPLSVAATQDVVRRWRDLGVADARPYIAGWPRIVTVTSRGYALAGITSQAPGYTRIAHTALVARCRLWVEGLQPEALWTSERALIEEAGGIRAMSRRVGLHTPDAVVHVGDDVAAIEVEATRKPVPRLRKILALLLNDDAYTSVRYYCATPEVARAVEAAAAPGVAPDGRALPAPGPVNKLVVRMMPTLSELTEQGPQT